MGDVQRFQPAGVMRLVSRDGDRDVLAYGNQTQLDRADAGHRH